MTENMIDPKNDKEYKTIKKLYAEAQEQGLKQFDYNGNPLLVTFAKYLIQYIEQIRSQLGLKLYSVTGRELKPSVDPQELICECQQCDYTWEKRTRGEPIKCPSCQSKTWKK